MTGAKKSQREDADATPSFVAPIESLLLDEVQVAALLKIKPTSVCNLGSRDPSFPRPVEWALDCRRWRRSDVVAYVEKLRQRRA